MKRALALCMFLALAGNSGDCASVLFQPLQPLKQPSGVTSLADPYVQNTTAQDNLNFPKINDIERVLFGKVYSKQDILLRVARIEKSIFSVTYPNMVLSQRVDNILMNFNQMNQYPNISKNTLLKMESKVFNQNFAQNDIETRIEQLEQKVLGTVQSGDLNTRYETLKAAISGYKSNNPSAYNNDYVQSQMMSMSMPMSNQNGRRGIGNILSSMLGGGGCMTGFTPSINPYVNSGYNNYSNNVMNYANSCGPNNYGYYNGNRTNRGYSDAFSSFGTGTGVTILD